MKPKNLGRLTDHIRSKRPLTTFEASRICGVVHGTVSKWIDDGKLSAYRTPGRHRRVRLVDMMVFLKLYNIPMSGEIKKAFAEALDGDE